MFPPISAFWLNILIGLFFLVSIYVAFSTGLVGRVMTIVSAFDRLLKSFERQGEGTREWKEQLRPLMRYLPPANVQTISRGLVLNGLNLLMWRGQYPAWLLPVFIIFRLTDFTDGLKARYERDRRKRLGLPIKPSIGPWLDPMVDIPTDLITCLVLWPNYRHGWLIPILLGLTVCRFLLFIAYRIWSKRHTVTGILPPDIAGQSKAWFLAISFGLILLNRQSSAVVSWSEIFLSVALFLEARGIYNQFRSALRQRQQLRP